MYGDPADTGDGFLSALMNPALAGGLGGLASGFAQAAMPSRMPIPFGAALGLAAGGMQSGIRSAYQNQLAEQQARAGQMQNLVTAAGLPLTLAKNRMLTQIWQNPEMMQQIMQGTGSSAPMGMPQSAGGSEISSRPLPEPAAPAGKNVDTSGSNLPQAALSSVPEAYRIPAINAALSAKLPVEAWPHWLAGIIPQESAWNPNAVSPKGAIGLGQVMPATGQEMGFTPQQLADPATNLKASAMYYAKKWQEAQGDPARAAIGYNSGSVTGTAEPGYVEKVMGGVQKIGGQPAVGQPGQMTPQDALRTANMYLERARRAGLAQQLGLPSGEDPAALRATAQEYLKVALAGPQAAAAATAKFANEPISDRFGNLYIGDGNGGIRYLGRGPEVKQVWDPEKGQMVWSNVGGTGVGGESTSGGAGQAAEPPPDIASFKKEYGTELAQDFKKINVDAASAKESNYLFDNLRNDSQTWEMGKFADWEGDARAWLSAAAHSFGLQPEGLDKKLSDYQAFVKSAGSLLRTAVHDTSSRAAVQEYNLIGHTLPQPTTSQQAFGQIADQWQALNDYRLAKQKFAQGYLNKPQDFNLDFNSQVSPTSFLLYRMSQTPQGKADMTAMLQRMQQTSEGRMQARHMLVQFRSAREHGLFDGLPPTGTQTEAENQQ